MNSNIERFQGFLASVYVDLFANDPEYSYSASKCTPEGLAQSMTLGLHSGRANKDGEGVKRTCKHFGIKQTYKAIQAFLGE